MYQRQVSFDQAIKMALTQNYCNFQGRSSRSEFWWFYLFTLLVSCAISLIFGTQSTTGEIVSGLVSLAFLLPSLGLSVRRLHDIGRSAWWILIVLIPLVGWIIWIVWMCKDSDMHPNQYGPVPNVVA